MPKVHSLTAILLTPMFREYFRQRIRHCTNSEHTEQWERSYNFSQRIFVFFFFLNWCDVPTILFARQSTYGSRTTHSLTSASLTWYTNRRRTYYSFFFRFIMAMIASIRIFTSMQNATIRNSRTKASDFTGQRLYLFRRKKKRTNEKKKFNLTLI